MCSIRAETIDDYVAKRRLEKGKKPKSKVSPATINRELRHLKSALRIAHDWGYLPVVPKLRKVREEHRIGAIIAVDHFKAFYDACSTDARMPEGLATPPGDWWQALLVFAITTGWRIDEMLSLRRDDIDLKTGAVMTRRRTTRGGETTATISRLKPWHTLRAWSASSRCYSIGRTTSEPYGSSSSESRRPQESPWYALTLIGTNARTLATTTASTHYGEATRR